jgi:hypothetical protein
MGDRCFLEITVHSVPADKKKEYEDAMLQEFDVGLATWNLAEDGESPHYEVDEINYGGYRGLELLADLGVIADGSHSAGGNYPASNFILMDGAVVYSSEDGPTGVISRDGVCDDAALAAAADWYEALDKLTALTAKQDEPS